MGGGSCVMVFSRLRASVLALTCSGCAIMPDLPPDWALPTREILLHSACELQRALKTFDTTPPPRPFNPRLWTVKISLNPKVDADIQPGAGLTRRHPVITGVARFSNLVLGGGNGLQLDMKGQRTGNLDFVLESGDLMDASQLNCQWETPHYHSLTKQIGIADWLVRSVDAAIATGSSIDKPSFSSDVFIKFGGNGSYTYTMPIGTDLLTLAGYYQMQQTLNINLTAKNPRLNVVTLPLGGDGFLPNNGRENVRSSVFQDTRSDLQQIEQAIRNLRPTIQ